MLILLHSDRALGQKQSLLIQKYREPIQNYIMTGQEKGWQHCDILSAYPSYEGVPQISMTLEKLTELDIKSAFAHSHCLLVNYHIRSESNLSALLDFGWATIQHVRLALLIKMESGITLNMARNTTKMPFLVAAELDHGKEQFLCPFVGETEPRLEQVMCRASYVHYKNKTIRIGLVGTMPEFILTSNSTIEGTGIQLINILAQKFKFMPEVVYPNSISASESLVCIK